MIYKILSEDGNFFQASPEALVGFKLFLCYNLSKKLDVLYRLRKQYSDRAAASHSYLLI